MVLALIEALFLLALVSGVYITLGLGAALIACGVLGILACEWQSARRAR